MLLLLVGCADFLAISEAFDDLTNPLVVQSVYMGVEPLPPGVELGESAYASGSTARVLLADASNVDELDEAPVITDATIVLEMEGGAVPLRAEAEGAWVADTTDGLGWDAGDAVSLEVEREDGTHRLALVTPDAPKADIEAEQAKGEPLVVDLTGATYDNIVVTVVRLEDGETVYDSMPTDIAALYRLTHAADELVVEVPGSAFSKPGVYAVGVAGLVNAHPDDYEDVNVALSALTAGSFVFSAVTVRP